MAKAWSITAEHLERWAERVDAAAELPKLVRRLLAATAPDAWVEMRGDAGVRFSGWDGVVQAQDERGACPRGVSVWEFSVDQKVKSKLDEDFEKRVRSPAPPITSTQAVAYVAVVARRFAGKQKWVQDKSARRAFREVRVYDADDLATWLENAPAVSRWFAPQIGLPSYDALDVEAYLEAWSRRTSPPLPWDLVLAGQDRERLSAEVLRWVSYPANQPLRIQGQTREEGLLFVAATLAKAPDASKLLARAIVVETADAFAQAIAMQSTEPLIVLPTYEGADASRVVRGQAYVVLGLDQTLKPKPGEAFVLDELPWRALAKRLEENGFSREEADRLVQERGGKLDAMQRALGYVELPSWAKGARRPELFAFLLAGAWVPSNEGDRKAVERLGGEPDRVEALCVDLEKSGAVAAKREFGSPPFYSLASVKDAWELLGDDVTQGLRTRFADVVMDVLGAKDPMYELPPADRFAAVIHGKALPYSHVLREGLAVSLVMLSQHGQKALAEGLLWRLFDGEKGWIPWASLSDFLPTLAEASPEVFLDVLESSLDRGDEGVCHLFAEEGRGGMGRGSTPHTGLLRALERLAWAPDVRIFRRVALALARLAEADKDGEQPGKVSNRPIRSLGQILSYWLPQSTTTAEQRVEMVGLLLRKYPEIGLRVACEQLRATATGGSMFLNPRPEFLRWNIRGKEEGISDAELNTQIDGVLGLVIEYAKEHSSAWARLLDVLRDEQNLKTALDALEQKVETIQGSDGSVWKAVRERIAHELRGNEDKSRARLLGQLERIYKKLTPSDPLSQIQWLFEPRPTLPEKRNPNFEKRYQRIQEERANAINQLWQTPDPWSLLESLAQRVTDHEALGHAVGQSEAADGFEARLRLGTLSEPLRKAIPNFVWARQNDTGQEWFEDLLRTLHQAQRFDDCLLVAYGGRSAMQTWKLLEELGEALDSRYWRELPSFSLMSRPADELSYALDRLLRAERWDIAFEAASLYHDEVTSAMAVRVLEAVIAAIAKEQNRNGIDPHNIQQIFEAVDRDGTIEAQKILNLELFFLGAIEESERGPKYVSNALSESPETFADLVCKIYRRHGEPRPPEGPSEEGRGEAKVAFRILEAWNQSRGYPGKGLPPAEKEAKIEAWAMKTLALTKAEGRAETGAIEVAKVLARAPNGADGAWPCIAARRLLERGEYPDLGEYLQTAKRNLRGMWTRGMLEGGAQERDLAAMYREYAEKVEGDYPRTAAMLSALAREYDEEAEQHDEEARRRRIEGGDEEEAEPPPSPPQAHADASGGPLKRLEIKHLGLAPSLAFDFAPRLNLLTGDNSIGKTLALNIAWWVLTGSWGPGRKGEHEAMMARPPQRKPNADARKHQTPSISAQAGARSMTALYDARHERWSGANPLAHNLVLYARVDGSFSIWDPIRNAKPLDSDSLDLSKGYHFSASEILDGQWIPGTTKPLCKGMITDLVDWKHERPESFRMLQKALDALSPPTEALKLSSETQRFSIHDARKYPKIKLPYGEVFPNHTSAGVMRILGLSYALVWAISEIKEAAGVAEESSIRHVTFIIDEVEAHLHPKWQRQILTSLLSVVGALGLAAEVQLLVTTHAPLVLASIEPHFDEAKDKLFDFNLVGDHVEIRTDLWRMRGDVTSWLASEVFDGTSSRSKEATEAMAEAAKAFDDASTTPERGREIYEELLRVVPELDPFWVRFRFLAEKRGWLA